MPEALLVGLSPNAPEDSGAASVREGAFVALVVSAGFSEGFPKLPKGLLVEAAAGVAEAPVLAFEVPKRLEGAAEVGFDSAGLDVAGGKLKADLGASVDSEVFGNIDRPPAGVLELGAAD